MSTADRQEACRRAFKRVAETRDDTERLRLVKKALTLFTDGVEPPELLLDSYIQEVQAVLVDPSLSIRLVVIEFLTEICFLSKKTIRYSVASFGANLLTDDMAMLKGLIRAFVRLYPTIFRCIIDQQPDLSHEEFWTVMSQVKGIILSYTNDDDQEIQILVFKFIEVIIMCQSLRSEGAHADYLVHLNDITPDHKVLKHDQLHDEGKYCLSSILDQIALPHISYQCLIVALGSAMSIARIRNEHVKPVIDCLEMLYINLPPHAQRRTSKIHSKRAEDASVAAAEIAGRNSEIQRALYEAKEQVYTKRQKQSGSRESRKRPATGTEYEAEVKKSALEADDDEPASSSDRTAVDITYQFIIDRLSQETTINLVLATMPCLPNKRPASLQNSFDIQEAGSKDHKMMLCRMLATQLTQHGIGPGMSHLDEDKRKRKKERDALQRSGAILPPEAGKSGAKHSTSKLGFDRKPLVKPKTVEDTYLPVKSFDLLEEPEDEEKLDKDQLFALGVRAVMGNEEDIVITNHVLDYQLTLVRLLSRFETDPKTMDGIEMLINFIIADHHSRAELMVLWFTELYTQYLGYSFCGADKTDKQAAKEAALGKYNMIVDKFLRKLVAKGLLNEMVFHRFYLEAPLLSPAAMTIFKEACLSQSYGHICLITLREMIIARVDFRETLLRLLIDISVQDVAGTSVEASKTAKELFTFRFIRDILVRLLKDNLQKCTVTPPPPSFAKPGEPAPTEWTDKLYSIAVQTYLELIPQDPALIHYLASVYAVGNNLLKKAILQKIELPIANHTDTSEIVNLINNCPQKAETLVARIVHVLSVNNLISKPLVKAMQGLYERRSGVDVRSFVPILNHLPKEQILAFLPSLMLETINHKTVGYVFKRLTSPTCPLSAVDLIISIHRLQPENDEQAKLQRQHITLLYNDFGLSSDTISHAVDKMFKEKSYPDLIYDTIFYLHYRFKNLANYVKILLPKMAESGSWREDGKSRKRFFELLRRLESTAFPFVLSRFNEADVKDFLKSAGSERAEKELLSALRTFYAQASHDFHRKMDESVVAMVKGKESSRKPFKTKSSTSAANVAAPAATAHTTTRYEAMIKEEPVDN
ncbi:unnamed protein product, partial [Mesorhabditis spiculigera]